MNNDFTITFWIRVAQNPGWVSADSEINFPPFCVNGEIQVYFSKYEKKLNIYILHPKIGYRKLAANIGKYIQKDAFVALTNSKDETKLYINGDLISEVKKSDLIASLEVGDYVMVEVKKSDHIDRLKFKLSDDDLLILPAKVKKMKKSKVTLLLLGGLDTVADFNISRLYYEDTANISFQKLDL